MVTTTVLLCVVAAVVILLLAWAVLRRDHVDETERFHRASAITSSWAAPGPSVHRSEPVAEQPAAGQDQPGSQPR